MRARAWEKRAEREGAGGCERGASAAGGRERKGREEMSSLAAARERGPSRNDRALVSPKRSYFFISFGDPVEGASRGGCAPRDSLR